MTSQMLRNGFGTRSVSIIDVYDGAEEPLKFIIHNSSFMVLFASATIRP